MQFSTETYARKLFFDGPFREQDKGVVDGMKVHSSGIVFVTGPGGIHLVSEEGERLAHIRLDHPTTNLCFNPDETFLYFTTHTSVARLKINRFSEPTR